MSKKLPYKLVEVLWKDAESHDEWVTLSDITDDNKPLDCVSVGFLVKETEDRVILCATLSLATDNQVSGHITIPKGMITAIKNLTYKGKPRVKKEAVIDR